MKVIINADDLGHSRVVNDRIFELIDAGKVTSATLIANGAAFDHAVERMRQRSHASFGVHLNLTEFAPLTRHPGLRPILGRNGRFARDPRTMPLTADLKLAIFEEWCAQVRRALEAGVPVSHFDSHHQVHSTRGLFFVLKRLQREFGIYKVRRARNVLGRGERMSVDRRLRKVAWNAALTSWIPTRTTDGFASFSTFQTLLPDRVRGWNSLELMCHPGSERFDDETRMIESAWRSGREDQFQLASYHDL
jgi:predicted glycoside hydrolase/deacetylase ChbG (UPF0249 family)